MIRARFVPQAWVGDNVVDVDTDGVVTWDATADFAAMSVVYRQRLEAKMAAAADGEALDTDDRLRDGPAAPTWVRDWPGPFSIWVRRDTYAVTICWGGTGRRESEYEFDSAVERDAFLQGAAAAIEWLDYEIVSERDP